MHRGPSTLGGADAWLRWVHGRPRLLLDQLREHVRAFFTNWQEYDAGFWTKVGLTLKNRTARS